jgi:hypothetical protein
LDRNIPEREGVSTVIRDGCRQYGAVFFTSLSNDGKGPVNLDIAFEMTCM